MKTLITGFVLLFASLGSVAQSKSVTQPKPVAQSRTDDSVAVLIIDRMADVISDMESCSFTLNAILDVRHSPKGLVKQLTNYEVYLSGPNKMLVNAHGHKGHRQLMYNGKQLAYYSFDEHNYGVINAPETTIKTIDNINKQYDIEFPAADFFYPAFTDDLLEQSDSLRFLGLVRIEEKEYFHVIAFGKESTIQFWIHNGAYNLPSRFAITYHDQPGNPQYMATFSDWKINPNLPTAMFDFLPPPGAAKVRIVSKTESLIH